MGSCFRKLEILETSPSLKDSPHLFGVLEKSRLEMLPKGKNQMGPNPGSPVHTQFQND